MNRLNSPYIIVTTLSLAALFAAVLSRPAAAQIRIPYSVVAPGGEASNGSFKVYDVVGQAVTGTMTAPTNIHQLGYLPVIKDYLLGSLTAVTITSFAAEAKRGRVRLFWTIGAAKGLLGYNVYRRESSAGNFVNISGGVIPSVNGPAYEDTDIRPGTTYYYRVGAVDGDGEFFSQTISVSTPVWKTELRQNHPNPFNPSTTVSFYLSTSRRVTVTIFDARGKVVRKLADGLLVHGEHEVQWDGKNDRGDAVGSGIYFYRLRAGKEVFTKKMTLLK